MPEHPRLFSLLRDGQFRRVWLVGLASGTARWLEMLVLGIYAFETTGSPFLVALLVILRMAPLPILGSLVGAIADRFQPRRLLGLSLSMIVVVSAVMAALFQLEVIEYWHIAVATFLSGVVWTTDMPVRRRLLGEIAGAGRLAQAMGLDAATNNVTRMMGPLLGGIIYQFVGGAGAYGLSFVLYTIALLLILSLRYRVETGRGGAGRVAGGLLRDFSEAFRYAWASPDIRRILGVTMVFNIWGFPFTAMVPVIGREELGLSAFWVGALSASEGGGAFLGALVIAAFARPRWFRRIYYYGAFAQLILIFLAGWAPGAFSTAGLFLIIGLANAAFGTMQATLIYSVAPAEMRGRLYGLLVICIGTGLIGFANVGLMGEWFGASNALKIIGLEGLIPLLLIGWRWRELHRR